MIPHLNKTVDILLSERIDAHTVNVREVIDDLRGQVEDYTAVFEAVVLIAPRRFRVTFKSSRKMEVVENSGLLVRGLPVDFVPVSQFKWVNVTRLSCGIPNEEIRKVLETYGAIRLIKSEVYSLIYTGVHHVLMEVRENIPSRLKIAGHWCFVHYRGQKRVCFQCGKEGHQQDRCLSNLARDSSVRTAAARPVETRTAPANDTTVAATVPRQGGVQVPASAAVELASSEQDFFLNSLDHSLSNEEAVLCEGEVTLAECTQALKSFKCNKSPALDGLPCQFYRMFWDLIGPDMVATFNDSFTRGLLSFSQRTGLITLLYKKHDRLDTKNWRPISLLCTDYKILSKVLTNRLKSVLASVISESQSCGVPGRFSGSNIRTLQDIVNYCNFHRSGGAIVSLDQEKAFDRVDWGYMQKVLQHMNFGPSFCSWVRLVYHNIFSRVLVNVYTSGAFAVTRGVRQGCPLSPLLYIIVAETIACAIKKDRTIDGFRLMTGEYVKVFQYADDTSVIVHSDESLCSLFSLFERYERASGAKLNVSKSLGLLFGTWKYWADLLVQLDWSSEIITVLGCRIANEESVDWDSLITKFESQLTLWQQRQLSFRGRALVANVLGLSLFWYQATVFDMPKTVIFKINKILFPVVWGKKREWMARTSIIQPLHQERLCVLDVSQKVLSLRAVWLRRFFSNPHHPWSSFFSLHVASSFSSQSVAQVLSHTPIPAYLIKKLPPFYRGILTVWAQLKVHRPMVRGSFHVHIRTPFQS